MGSYPRLIPLRTLRSLNQRRYNGDGKEAPAPSTIGESAETASDHGLQPVSSNPRLRAERHSLCKNHQSSSFEVQHRLDEKL